ncbi:P-loop NTPase fold protein [Vibrio parahaemolyticus]
MPDLNHHARKLIEYYCSMKVPPEYALLIKGAWGCGKSHLVKTVIGEMTQANKDLKFLSVSLYGIKDIGDIEAKFFEQLNPILANKKVMFAGQIAKGVLKGALKIDLDGDSKPDASANISVPEINLAEYLTDTKNCILVFDDLERCSMDIQVILGYINYFVEKDGYKVLLVADESKLINPPLTQKESTHKYQSIKEKLIGKTVEVEADVSRVYDYFVADLITHSHRDLILRYKSVIIGTFNESNYKNLRSLRKCFLDIEQWIGVLDDAVLSKADLMEHFLAIFVSVSMEVHAGRLLPKDVGRLYGLGIDYLNIADSKVSEVKDEFKDIKDKYSQGFLDSLIDISYLKQFFETGYIDKEKVNAAFRESRYFNEETTPDWKKLWYFHTLEDEDFTSLQTSVIDSFNKREFTNLCELKHVVGLLLMHSKHNLLDKTPEDLIEDTKSYLGDLEISQSAELTVDLIEELNGYEDGSYEGLGYTCREDASFQVMSDAINAFSRKMNQDVLKAESNALIEMMNSSSQSFLELFQWSNDTKNYSNTPILQFAPIDGFFDTFITMPIEAKRRFVFILKDRLQDRSNTNHKLHSEFDWIKEFNVKLNEYITQAEPAVSKVVLGYANSQLRDRILTLEKSFEERQANNQVE